MVFAACSELRRKVVASIPSGPVMPSLTATSSVTPLAASMTLPSQSALMPYSNLVPGSATSGAVKIELTPERTLGVPVTASQRTMSAFQNQ